MISIREMLDYLQKRRCYICHEDHWRITRTQSMEDAQDRTNTLSIEYECMKCGTKEKHQIEFNTKIVELINDS